MIHLSKLPAADAKPRRILIVDDTRAIHEDFKKILQRTQPPPGLHSLEQDLFADEAKPPSPLMDFEVEFAHQGQEGSAMVARAFEKGEPYSVAFVDMRMPPGWDGVQTIREMWKTDPDLQCVICTAYSDYAWEDILSELGVTDKLLLLRKPFDPAEVCQLASALSEKWHLARRAHLKLEQLRSMVEEQIGHLEQSNRRLAESEARYALAALGANDGLWDWNLRSNSVFYSPRWKALIGLPPDAPFGDSIAAWLEVTHPDDRERLERALDQLKQSVQGQLSIEYRIRHTDGQYRWMLCRGAAACSESGPSCRAAGSQSDITSRKMAETQLRHDALHDALTGLPNRVLLTERLERCLARQRREPSYRYAVMFIDMDRFKVINDSLGHGVGDALLVALASRLSSCMRETDTIAVGDRRDVVRLGGDEFVVLLEGIRGDADALRVADRLLTRVSEPILVEEHTIHTSLSIGIAIGHPGYERVEDVLRDADIALYRAKADGRGRYGVFTDELHAAAMTRWRTEMDLREAINQGAFVLHYQPVISLQNGSVLHAEALLRWIHPSRGMISPAEFIPLAEESGLIMPLGRWVIREACRQIRAWQALGCEMAVAVNVAAKQFAQPTFVDEVVGALEEANVPASSLQIELTESATMDPKAIDTCTRLSSLGIRIHLDDFGTGYSSLSYLTRMPIHALKVDRSFVMRMREDPMSASIVQTILTLASSLGMASIAEGVESQEEADALKRMNCVDAQGYFWAKPMDPERFLDWLRARRMAARLLPEATVGAAPIA